MSDKQLNVAVVGAGYWGKNLVRNFAAIPGSRLTMVCDADPEVLVARKQDLDLPTMKAMQALYAELAKRWDMTVVSTEKAPPPAVAKGILDRDFGLLVEKRRA